MLRRCALSLSWFANRLSSRLDRAIPPRLVLLTAALFIASVVGLLACNDALTPSPSVSNWLKNSEPLQIGKVDEWLDLPEKVFWSFATDSLLKSLNLDLDDFFFAEISRPKSPRGPRHSETLKQMRLAQDFPPFVPENESAWLLFDAELDLLDRRPYAKFAEWTPSHKCEVIIFTASPGTRSRNVVNSHFNHRVYAERHNACLLHLTCRRPRDNDESRKESMAFYHKAVEEALGTLPPSLIHIPNDGGCETWANPYFWKFIAFFKLLHMLRNERSDRVLMYIDEDVLFTNPALSPLQAPGINERNAFIIGTDFLAFSDVPIPTIPHVSIPINTGVMMARSQSRLAASVVVETLLFPYTRRSELPESIRRYWDTDQGVMTYLLDNDLGVDMSSIRQVSADSSKLKELVDRREPLLERRVPQSEGVVVVLPQKLLATAPRQPFQDDRSRPDLAFGPDDWMVHLTPGFPHLKYPAWKRLCETYRESHPGIKESCWWSMKRAAEFDVPTVTPSPP